MKIGNQQAARGLEAFAAKAEDIDVRLAAAGRGDQRAGVEIAGRLTARQHETFHSGLLADRFRKSTAVKSTRSIGIRSNVPKPTPFRSLTNLSASPTSTTDSCDGRMNQRATRRVSSGVTRSARSR